ncbi:MAG: MraY family glycosyltransferase [Chloroflexota bacterium]
MIFILIAAVAFVITALCIPIATGIGHRVGLVDRPGGRRKHNGVIPRTGGIAMFAGFFFVVLLIITLQALLPPPYRAWLPQTDDPLESRRLIALLLGSLFCVIGGYLDDRYDWSSLPQYAIQLGASLIAIAGLIFIKHVNNPFGDGFLFGEDGFVWWLVYSVTIFWFMGMMNTVNWLDGLNGLVAGTTAIFCIVLAVHMIFIMDPSQLSVAVLPMALLGAVLGFLPFNFAPATIFMGSTGSYFLGFIIATLGIIGGARLATVMLVLGLPALDVAWLIISRWRRGVSPAQGGRDHLHFRLIDRGLSERTIVFGYWLFCALFGSLTLLLDDRIYKLVALIALGLLTLMILIWASQEE